MKKLILISLFIFDLLILHAQDEFYTQGFENGKMWNYLSQPTKELKDYKQNYLASLLENQKLKKMSGVKSLPIFNCDEDIALINDLNKANQIDLGFMVKMIDEFYYKKENLIIPVLGAYCYSIKKLAGYSEGELISYREKLLEFSKSQLKK